MMTLHTLPANVMTFNLHKCLWSRVHALAASFIRGYGIASAGCSRCPDQGNQVFDLQTSGYCREERVSLVSGRVQTIFEKKHTRQNDVWGGQDAGRFKTTDWAPSASIYVEDK